ncbi:MAG: sigma-70 family RNA polymerase sigma factor [Ferruginibacter sp.]
MNANNTSTRIWEKHGEKLKSFICSKVEGNDDCHDILHDVFLKIKEKEDRIKLIERPASYVIKMAQNAVIDYYRLQKNVPQTLQNDDVEADHQASEIQLADCCLLPFIKSLPPIYSEALIQTELEGLSQKQFAEKLNISYTGAKSRVQRAKIMLKQAILDCCPYQFDKYGNIIDCCK